MEIHQAIQEFIIAKNLTVAKLAQESGITRGYLYKILNGEHSPTLYTLDRLAKVLEIPLSEIILFAENDVFFR
ncbi:MAG: helix-turn-helix transcriptional regulator [Sphaerochaetaceae bacterium]|nr:helix-turn-helix transcriptional regulator [Sphaerochaetaceae bacterium]